jgi:hypothetical protein
VIVKEGLKVYFILSGVFENPGRGGNHHGGRDGGQKTTQAAMINSWREILVITEYSRAAVVPSKVVSKNTFYQNLFLVVIL